ncbi:MAG: hypothetical protein LBD46_00975 [Endomicrobium sp.]|nr:hypothetical protein [Endomicrobium sp.]
MKTFIVFFSAAVFSLSFFCQAVYAQGTYDLTFEQMTEGKKLREEYVGEKEELEIQLQKLIKDRNIAVKDNNFSLVERRNSEIKQTRERIKNLPLQYANRFSEILTEEQKENKVSDDFYEKELAAETAKIKAISEKENQIVKKSSKKTTQQNKRPSNKSSAKTKKK